MARSQPVGERQVHDFPKAAAAMLTGAGAVPTALPRVSVIVTCHNYRRFIVDALQSVAVQTYPSWDCVIVDDGSTDDSVTVVEKWLASTADARFRLIRNEANCGQIASIARALAASDSEFVALLDADDFWFPEFLQRHVAVHLNRSGAVSLTCSDEIQVDAAGRVLTGGWNSQKLWRSRADKPSTPISRRSIPHIDCGAASWDDAPASVAFIEPDVLTWHWTTTSAMVFRRPMLELAIPESSPPLKMYADLFLVPICHYFTGSIVLDEALGAYRRHGDNHFSRLPVAGAMTLHPVADGEMGPFLVQEAILRHLLDRQDAFSAMFGKSRVRKFVRAHFRYLLAYSRSVDEPRIRTLLGRSRYWRDRLRIGLRRLWRKSPTIEFALGS
jgi:glycosyltransferase involved in cell wall biosynthesis